MWWPFKKKKDAFNELLDNSDSSTSENKQHNSVEEIFNNLSSSKDSEERQDYEVKASAEQDRYSDKDFSYHPHVTSATMTTQSFSNPIIQSAQQSVQYDLAHVLEILNKNIEVISSKLDALKATMDSMNQRLMLIEKIAKDEYDESKKKLW